MMKKHALLSDSLNLFSLLLLFQAVLCHTVLADTSKTLITAGPSWQGFTEKDGKGLYHDLIRQIFSDYTIHHAYVPTMQANSMVAIGRADIKMCETKPIDSLVLSTTPMYENHYYVVFLRERIPEWRGNESLENRLVAWREGYYSKEDFSVDVKSIEVRSGASALQMVILGRADFYVDDMKLILQSFSSIGKSLDPAVYGVERIGARQYFPVFADSERGNALRAKYESRMLEMYDQGVLQEIYSRYGFTPPQLRKGQ